MTIEELRDSINRVIPWGGCIDRLNELIAVVEERTKKRILDASVAKFNMGGGVYVIIRTSVLNPKKADNGNN